MSFEMWRRALLARSGVLGTMQREWRRDRNRDRVHIEGQLEHITRDLTRLQETVERLSKDLKEVARVSRRQTDKIDGQGAAIESLRAQTLGD